MNDNNYSSHENGEQNNEKNDCGKEEIRFDDWDFDNSHSGHFENNNNTYGNGYTNRSYNGFEDFKVNEDSPRAPLIDEAREKSNFNRIGAGYLLFSLISSAVALIIQFSVLVLNAELLDNLLFINLLSPVCLYLFALPVLLTVLSRCEAKAPEKKKLGVGKFLLFVITAFGFMYIGALVGNAFMDLLSGWVGYDYSNGLDSIIDEDNIWVTAIFTVIVAPIGEEFVFRKLLIDRTQKYGAFISIGLSGLMFGLMHGNFYQFFYAFALGLLLGYIYFHTGKLYLTIAIHAIVNFVGSVLTSFLTPISEKLLELNVDDTESYMTFIQENLIGVIAILAFDLFVYGSMACAIIFTIVFRKKLSFPGGEVFIPREKVTSVVILNGGILAMLIVYLLEFGLNIFLPLLA